MRALDTNFVCNSSHKNYDCMLTDDSELGPSILLKIIFFANDEIRLFYAREMVFCVYSMSCYFLYGVCSLVCTEPLSGLSSKLKSDALPLITLQLFESKTLCGRVRQLNCNSSTLYIYYLHLIEYILF